MTSDNVDVVSESVKKAHDLLIDKKFVSEFQMNEGRKNHIASNFGAMSPKINQPSSFSSPKSVWAARGPKKLNTINNFITMQPTLLGKESTIASSRRPVGMKSFKVPRSIIKFSQKYTSPR